MSKYRNEVVLSGKTGKRQEKEEYDDERGRKRKEMKI